SGGSARGAGGGARGAEAESWEHTADINGDGRQGGRGGAGSEVLERESAEAGEAGSCNKEASGGRTRGSYRDERAPPFDTVWGGRGGGRRREGDDELEEGARRVRADVADAVCAALPRGGGELGQAAARGAAGVRIADVCVSEAEVLAGGACSFDGPARA